MSLSEESVEAWLKDNPTFLHDYITRAPPGTINKNVAINKFSSVAKNVMTSKLLKTYLNDDSKTKTVDSKNAVVNKLQEMDEESIFMELVRDIASELDVNVLCHKILRNVSILTNSDRGSLFLTRGGGENRFLVSKLFDVTQTSTLEESLHTEDTEIKVPFGKGIAGHVAQTREEVNILDAYKDPRFNQAVDKKTGYRTHSILCMPILNHDDVIGVAQIINKTSGVHAFSNKDVHIFRKYLTFCGIGIMNAQLFEMSVKEFQRNKLLLSLAREIFEEQTSLQKLVQMIMLDAQDLLKCERCSVYLLEDFSANTFFDGSEEEEGGGEKLKVKRVYQSMSDVVFSTAFDLYADGNGNIEIPSSADIEKSPNTQISKLVVIQGSSINIPDLKEDIRFGNEYFVDESGFKTRMVLCTPIYNSKREIIGVTQLINKSNGRPFYENDENIIEAFSIFTGLGIHNCFMYENVCRLMAKQNVALEVLSYHATAADEEVTRLTKECSSPEELESWELHTFEFDDFGLDDFQTCIAAIKIFKDTEIIDTFKVPLDVICRWTLSVRKNYRPVTYHNWRHAFNVFQTMYTILFTGKLKANFDLIEIYGLLTACLCHDLDHRGTNNAFQVKAESPLAMLYSTSVMEHHHFDHSIMILNSKGNNIFTTLNADDYRKVLGVVEHAILSTDLALYFKKRGEFKSFIDQGVRDFSSPDMRQLLTAMMMTVCDVAAICKPWDVQYRTAQLVASEFFEQGDLERDVLGENPIAMMDRSKENELPKMQVGFIDAICLPVYKLFSELNESLSPLYEGCFNNRKNWQELAVIEGTRDADTQAKAEAKLKAKAEAAARREKRRSERDQMEQERKKSIKTSSKSKLCTIL